MYALDHRVRVRTLGRGPISEIAGQAAVRSERPLGTEIALGRTRDSWGNPRRTGRAGNACLNPRYETRYNVHIVRLDPVVVAVYDLARSIAQGNISALIVGETGSGKEHLAEAIHAESKRADKPLLKINCAALSETLLESELFGYERGAFTGAMNAKQGLLESANGGSVFLDELGEMTLSLQSKLLRVLEERRVTRVGGLKSTPIDIRLISATNRDLEEEIESKSFRKDLYYRLNGVTLALPPLRERRSEIEPLARNFLANAAREIGRATPEISPAAFEWMLSHGWPGNIRELRNAMERAALVCDGMTLEVWHLPKPPRSSSPPPPPPLSTNELEAARGAGRVSAQNERDRIVGALEACVWNQTRAAKRLGISRGTLVARMAEYNLPRPRKSRWEREDAARERSEQADCREDEVGDDSAGDARVPPSARAAAT